MKHHHYLVFCAFLLTAPTAYATTLALRRTQSVVREFDFEYRLFYEASDQEQALSTLADAVSEDLTAYYQKLNANVQVQSVVSVSRGNCDSSDLQEDVASAFTSCVKAYSTISLLTEETMDSSILQRATLLRVNDFVSDTTSIESMATIYDYPKLVQTSVLLRLIGQGETMDADEQFLFLQTLQEGFVPTLEAAFYEFIEAKIIAQQAGTATTDLSISNSEQKDLYNRVEVMIRAQCSGDSCTDENFGNWLQQNMESFAQEFLGRLYTVGPPDKEDMYYDDLQKIQVGDSLLVTPLNPPKSTNTENHQPEDADLPKWLWAVLVAAIGIIVFAIAWTCVRVGIQKGTKVNKQASEKGSTSLHGSQAERGNSVAGGSKDEVEDVSLEEPEEERI